MAMEIYEKIRYYREHTDLSQRNVSKILGISRNTVKNIGKDRLFRVNVSRAAAERIISLPKKSKPL